jgi:integrase
MARQTRSGKLETRTGRLKLKPRPKPHFVAVAPNIALGYRRCTGPGRWIVRSGDGHGHVWTKKFALADDHEAANGGSVMDYWQALAHARAMVRGGEGTGDKPPTVAEALDHYEASLRATATDERTRNMRVGNVTRVRHNLPASLMSKTVSLLGPRELRQWRDGLVAGGLAPSTADRTARMLTRALNLLAGDDQRVTNASAWRTGLKRLPNAEVARSNVILPVEGVAAIVAAAREVEAEGGYPGYGLLTEVLAYTGTRESQAMRLRVEDLQDKDPLAPRLMMPSSRKGRGRKVERKPLPIPADLGRKLRAAAGDRPDDAPLLTKVVRTHVRFKEALARTTLDQTLTPYCLRHSAIVRMLMKGVPTRVVASYCDTSVGELERCYSKYIVGDPSDVILRAAFPDLDPRPTDRRSKVVKLAR